MLRNLLLFGAAVVGLAVPRDAMADEAPRWPVSGYVTEVTEDRGGYTGHQGTDIATPTWTSRTVFACASGRVAYRTPDGQPSSTAGNFIVLDHGGGWRSRYLHLLSISSGITVGQPVTPQTILGVEGNTGKVIATNGGDGSHLHFEFFRDTDGDNFPDAGEWVSSPYGIKNQWVYQGQGIPGFPLVPGTPASIGTTTVIYAYTWYGWWGQPSVAFFWNNTSGASGYDVELSYLPLWGGSWTTLTTFSWSATSVSFGPLPSRWAYYRIRVRPKSSSTTGNWSSYHYVLVM